MGEHVALAIVGAVFAGVFGFAGAIVFVLRCVRKPKGYSPPGSPGPVTPRRAASSPEAGRARSSPGSSPGASSMGQISPQNSPGNDSLALGAQPSPKFTPTQATAGTESVDDGRVLEANKPGGKWEVQSVGTPAPGPQPRRGTAPHPSLSADSLSLRNQPQPEALKSAGNPPGAILQMNPLEGQWQQLTTQSGNEMKDQGPAGSSGRQPSKDSLSLKNQPRQAHKSTHPKSPEQALQQLDATGHWKPADK